MVKNKNDLIYEYYNKIKNKFSYKEDYIYEGGPFTGKYKKYKEPFIACDRAYVKNGDLAIGRFALAVFFFVFLLLAFSGESIGVIFLILFIMLLVLPMAIGG